MNSKKIIMLGLLVALQVALVLPARAEDRKLQVVTSFLPIQSHAMAIAGELAEVSQLLNKDTGPHDFQLTPADVRKIADADLFVINGAGLEEWMGALVERAGNKSLTVVNTAAGIELAEGPEELDLGAEEKEKCSHGHEHEHGHSGCGGHDGENPHVWLDPVLVRQQAQAILIALQKADPCHAEAYAANAAQYFQKLDALDAEYREVLEQLSNKNLVTFHDAFPYLAKRYGLNYVGFIEEFPEKDPTPKELAALVQAIRANQVGVLFAEKGYASSLLGKIAEQTGAKVSELDTLEVGQGSPDAYIERMRGNLQALRKAFAATGSEENKESK